MTRLTMGFGSPLLSCFVIVAAATFAESLVIHKEEESLMWPDTPIFLAGYNENDHSVNYTRIFGLDTIMEGLSTWKGWGEVHDEHDLVNPKEEVIYPSVLLVMDYQRGPDDPEYLDPEYVNSGSSKWHPGQLLIYALAFWNSVGEAMKDLREPRVVIQIAGIVITDSRGALPYMDRSEGPKTYSKAMSRMTDYWNDNSTKRTLNIDNHPTNYDIVVHMTDFSPIYAEEYNYGDFVPVELVAAQRASPCRVYEDRKGEGRFELEGFPREPNYGRNISGIILNDNMRFGGVSRAVAAMHKVLGDDDDKMSNPIPHALENLPCMAAPKDTLHSGEPFPPISREDMADHWPECQIPGYNSAGAWKCYKAKTYYLNPLRKFQETHRIIQCSYRGEQLQSAIYNNC